MGKKTLPLGACKLKPTSLFGQIAATLLGFAGIFFVIVYVSTLYYSNRDMERQMVQSNTEILEQTNGTINQTLDNLSLMLNNTLMGPDVIRLAISPSLREFENMKSITNALTNAANSSTLIDSAFLYSTRSDLGLSSDYKLSNYQDYAYAAVLARFQTRKNKLVPYDAHGTSTYFYTENNDIYLIQGFSNAKYEKCSCYILFHLNSARFYQMINYTGDESLIFYNANGFRMFMDSNTAVQDPDLLLKLVTKQKTSAGHFLFDRPKGLTSHVIYSANDLTGWTCVYVTKPTATLLVRYLYSDQLLVIACISIFTLCLVAGLWSAKRISRPISSLVQKLRAETATEPTPAARSEWEYLELTYSHLLSQKEELEQYLPLASDAIHERLFRDLLRREELPCEAIKQQLKLIHSPFDFDMAYVVLLVAIEPAGESQDDSLARELASLGLKAKINNVTGDLKTCSRLLNSFSMLTVVCGFADGPESEAACCTLTQALLSISLDGATPVWGVGSLVSGMMLLADSMDDAKNNLEFNQYHRNLPVMGFPDEGLYTVYIGEIRNLLTNMQREDIAKLSADVQKLLKNIGETIPDRAMVRHLYQLLIDLLLERLRRLDLDCGGLDIALMNVPDSDLCTVALETCADMMERLDHYFYSGQHLYIHRVKEYVHTRYTDPNLSLESAADFVGISSTYLSRVFKTIEQQNFNTYLNNCRVENVKKLLISTDMPAQEIGYLAGFCSIATFFRVFKKHTNMTPTQFRQNMNGEEDTL